MRDPRNRCSPLAMTFVFLLIFSWPLSKASACQATMAVVIDDVLVQEGGDISHCARPYIVYFGFGETELSERAEDYLVEFASRIRHLTDRWVVAGYTDTSGDAESNLALSRLRAQVVADFLVVHGVGPARLTVVGYGEVNTLVPTPDDAREPNNRRVEIFNENG